MRKLQVLASLERTSEQDVNQISRMCQMTLEAAGMLLLRLFRQGLVRREIDSDDGMYFYSLNQKGQDRLMYFRNRIGFEGGSNAEKS
jgi:DNA-binding MarR family transcriptional regulator